MHPGGQLEYASLPLDDKLCLSSCDCMSLTPQGDACDMAPASTALFMKVTSSQFLCMTLSRVSLAVHGWICLDMSLCLYTFKKWNISFGSVSEAVSQLRLSEAGGDC